ncbi:YecR-like lipofamily protein [Citrobacter rodentium]|jgi:hypothetical protein|uniref:Exported protein n=2 Tax=Citrobacter rodentium TaxID=67825 RepID=D2TN00_CITRI|nr:YecR-like lipofamily protein [Citrobacter rodentium]KIQ49184.1 outer membrane lipoprotein [Citrobacter rodentium]QBY28501.1 hypothetical protein E2R62_06310 [Citrobacter rodentium]UHO29628.1 YecR-like lipofamily protein [Citrobacter rodentium NBRC 105723 = DSM 16636]CBG88710.1 putative exported protein [Citrobacter rodentium ICC168]HAT8014924.1 hypothetical protein [Citrobacter rodentium NBRC 105723 = DSM 16636]
MKSLIIALSLTLLSGCTITRQAEVSEISATTGVVRLSYGQAMLQNARTDDYTAHGTATRECQQLGYANAVRFGQPVSTCSLYAGSLCLNEKITIAYQCQGIAMSQTLPIYY